MFDEARVRRPVLLHIPRGKTKWLAFYCFVDLSAFLSSLSA